MKSLLPVVHVKFRRFPHGEWEFGTLVSRAFGDGPGPCWVTVAPELPEGPSAPTTLTVPIVADRLRVVDEDYRTHEQVESP